MNTPVRSIECNRALSPEELRVAEWLMKNGHESARAMLPQLPSLRVTAEHYYPDLFVLSFEPTHECGRRSPHAMLSEGFVRVGDQVTTVVLFPSSIEVWAAESSRQPTLPDPEHLAPI